MKHLKKLTLLLTIFLSFNTFAEDSKSTKIVVEGSGPRDSGVIQSNMPLDAIQLGWGAGASAPGSSASQAASAPLGADPAPAPVFNTLKQAADAGINPAAASVSASAVLDAEPAPQIEQASWTDIVRDNSTGIFFAGLMILGGFAYSWHTSRQSKALDSSVDTRIDDEADED